jgi:hypothetical protein
VCRPSGRGATAGPTSGPGGARLDRSFQSGQPLMGQKSQNRGGPDFGPFDLLPCAQTLDLAGDM